VAMGYRNALTYFKCGRLGHISSHYRSITFLFSSSPLFLSSSTVLPPTPCVSFDLTFLATSLMASRSRVLHFLKNDLSAQTEADLTSKVVLEAKGVQQGDLLTALKFYFPCNGHSWSIKFIGNNRFLVHAL
jgi:hypothetical protein